MVSGLPFYLLRRLIEAVAPQTPEPPAPPPPSASTPMPLTRLPKAPAKDSKPMPAKINAKPPASTPNEFNVSEVVEPRTVDPMACLAESLIHAELLDYKHLAEIPADPGLYVWYFRLLTGGLQTETCLRRGEWVLLYLGKTTKSLRGRTKEHFEGDTIASGAIREGVGALLAKELNLRHHRKGDDWTLDRAGEGRLTEWLHQNARVAFVSLRDLTVRWPQSKEDESEAGVVGRCEESLIARHFVLPLNREQENAEICREVREAWRRCKSMGGRG